MKKFKIGGFWNYLVNYKENEAELEDFDVMRVDYETTIRRLNLTIEILEDKNNNMEERIIELSNKYSKIKEQKEKILNLINISNKYILKEKIKNIMEGKDERV